MLWCLFLPLLSITTVKLRDLRVFFSVAAREAAAVSLDLSIFFFYLEQ
jgi:hypothetical protein